MVTIRLPDELRDKIDAARGDVPRERWVRRVLEAALDEPQLWTPEMPVPGRRARTVVKNEPEPPAETPLPKIAKRHWAG